MVFINGRMLKDKRVRQDKSDYGPVTIKKGFFFVLGDNRPASFDSRDFGPLSREYIIGRVIYKF